MLIEVNEAAGTRHPGAAAALIVGAAYPDFDGGRASGGPPGAARGRREGVPDPAHIDAELGEFAEEIKALHPGGDERWRTLEKRDQQLEALHGRSTKQRYFVKTCD